MVCAKVVVVCVFLHPGSQMCRKKMLGHTYMLSLRLTVCGLKVSSPWQTPEREQSDLWSYLYPA